MTEAEARRLDAALNATTVAPRTMGPGHATCWNEVWGAGLGGSGRRYIGLSDPAVAKRRTAERWRTPAALPERYAPPERAPPPPSGRSVAAADRATHATTLLRRGLPAPAAEGFADALTVDSACAVSAPAARIGRWEGLKR